LNASLYIRRNKERNHKTIVYITTGDSQCGEGKNKEGTNQHINIYIEGGILEEDY
jgi:hypothetical protein